MTPDTTPDTTADATPAPAPNTVPTGIPTGDPAPKMITLPDGQQLPHRALAAGQACVVHVYELATGDVTEVHRTTDVLLEAPNWRDDELWLNGDGDLWRLSLASGSIDHVEVAGLPDLNNDHVLAPDGATMYVSGYDWHIHAVDLATGDHRQITVDVPERPMLHFLHGVSPDDAELAFIGVEPGPDGPFGTANVFTIPTTGGPLVQLTTGDRPADGSEYSPDGEWIYFNTEAFNATPGHAQIARMRRDGSGLSQLTSDERVNWFPHLAPDGAAACYLSYPPGTEGHPADLDVQLRVVDGDDWANATTVVSLFGGQGTINVNSWSPDGTRFAFVSYPIVG